MTNSIEKTYFSNGCSNIEKEENEMVEKLAETHKQDAMEKRKDKYFRDILSLYSKVSGTTSELLNLLTMVKHVPH